MPRLTKIYTRTGDAGQTSLGTRTRVPKDHPRVDAYGLADELSSVIGLALSAGPGTELIEPLRTIQNELFHLGSELCMPVEERDGLEIPGIEARHVERLEGWIDDWLEQLPPLENFILPTGTPAAASLHVARTVCRRAERALVGLARSDSIGEQALVYLNRLSDLLFVMARRENQLSGVAETTWDSRA